MTGSFFPDWPIMAVSLMNVILLLWLGVTVLLNAERRTWGVWLVGGGLLLGAAFFISHSAILGYGLDFDYFSSGLNLWWRIGWIPVIALPFVWYTAMLWYAGFWNDPHYLLLPSRQRGWLGLTFLLLVGLVGWLSLATPLPSFSQAIQFQLSASPAVSGIPLFLLIYPVYIILCIGLALNVLRHPASSERMMGAQARQRARPWLFATSAVLLCVSLLVAGVIGWVILNLQQDSLVGRQTRLAFAVAWFDLIISSLIAVSVILLGQAIVSYEVFTGKALPRREFKRQWWNAVILASGYGVVVGWSLVQQLRPIYSLLLTTILMVLFYALLSWRSYTWRERYIKHLRPFVSSQHLYDHLLALPTTAVPSEIDIATPFYALCQEVLGTQQAHLIPLGSLAPLVSPLSYPDRPDRNEKLPASLQEITGLFDSPQTICVPLDPALAGGVLWAVPLWSERGLSGVFLLGPKVDNGLYTQEEIEIARASGERLIDTQASAEIARRLMGLQRQRLVESQILDRQTRRVLHDDVLPYLHTVLLLLNGDTAFTDRARGEAIALLTDAHRLISDLLREIPRAPTPILIRRGIIDALKWVVQTELPETFDSVTWQIAPEVNQIVPAFPPLTSEVLFYAAREAIRNAAQHGRAGEMQHPFHLVITAFVQDRLIICIEDNGVGFSAGQPARQDGGHGLALHMTMLAIVGGTLDIESVVDAYTRVILALPLNLVEQLRN